MSLEKEHIKILSENFDKILVVTIPRLTARHQYVKDQLQGLPYEFFYGADKQELSNDFITQNYNEAKAKKLQRQGKPLNAGEIACSLSHRMVYEAMIKNNWQKVLILEDDVVPLINNFHLLEQCLNELPENWELVYLGYTKHEEITPALKRKQFFYKIISSLGLMRWSRKMVDNMLPQPFSPHLKKAGFHDCTHAYALTLEAAKKLVAAQTPVVYRADDALSHTILKGELNAFVTVPKFFNQDNAGAAVITSEIR